MDLAERVGSILVLLGAAWMFLGTLGLVRFPDVYTRLHAMGLASTVGIALVLLGVLVHFAPRTVSVSLLAGLALVFVLLAFPLATMAIIWAAHRTKVPLYSGTLVDEMELYDPLELEAASGALAETGDLDSGNSAST